MSIENSFNSDCEKIFQKHKLDLESKIDISDKTRELNFEEFYIFNELFKELHRDLALKLATYLKLHNPSLQQTLEPFVHSYLASFLALVYIPKIE